MAEGRSKARWRLSVRWLEVAVERSLPPGDVGLRVELRKSVAAFQEWIQ